MRLGIFINVLVTLWCLCYPTPTSTVSVDKKRQSVGNVNEDPYSKFLYYEKTQTYYPYDEGTPKRGPCGESMRLYKESNISYNGVCLCEKVAKHCPTRPLLYWNETQRCYNAYEQGPCRNGEWLISDNKGKTFCQRNPCPLKENTDESSHVFPFKYQNKCYRTNTTAFCDDNKRVFFMGTDMKPICLAVEPLVCFYGYSLAFSAQNSCPPNTELQNDGSCAKIVTFE